MLEKQKIKNKWIWGIVVVLNLIVSYGIIRQMIYKIPFGDNPAPNFILILGLVTTLALLVMLLTIYLEVTANVDKITIKFYPFFKREINFDEIKDIEIIKYKPLKDYGGWGIRYGRKGKAYTIDGNLGLSITLLNDKNILIGIKNKKLYKSLKIKNYDKN